MHAEIHEDLQQIGRHIEEMSARMDAEQARRAEMREMLYQPAAWQQPEVQAEAEPAPERSWQPAEAAADMEAEI